MGKKIRAGFTIVELLIGIVVVAVLAAVSVVAYNGMQSRARAAEISYGLAQAKKKPELYRVDNGSYPTTGNLASAGVINGSVSYQYTSDGATYCVTGTAGSISYKVSGTIIPTQGGCAGHGQGGVAPISNLVVNPSFKTNTNAWHANLVSASLIPSGIQGSSRLLVTKTVAGDGYIVDGMAALKPNTAYVVSFYAWAASPIKITAYHGLQERGGSSRWVAMQSSMDLTTTPQRFVVSGVTPSDAGVSGGVILRPDSSVGGVAVYYDGVMVTEGSASYGYADGSSTNWVWNGTFYSSTSTGSPL